MTGAAPGDPLGRALAAAQEAAELAAAHRQDVIEQGRDPADWEIVPGVAERLLEAFDTVAATLEGLVAHYDGVLPSMGPSYHDALVRRAARPVDVRRPPLLAPATADLLLRINGFRHAFRNEAGEPVHPQAAVLAPLAPAAVQAVIKDLAAFQANIQG